MSTHKIKIARDGTVTAIYDDRLKGLLDSFGKPTITRASFVEPNADGKWVADMSPSGGPLLPACNLREEALTAERDWLEEHLFHASSKSTDNLSPLPASAAGRD